MTHQDTILIGDNAPDSLAQLTELLTPEKFHLLTATNGHVALDLVAAHSPDLILLNTRLPGMNGLDVCREIKAHAETRDVPIILIDDTIPAQEHDEGFNAGAADFITKPFHHAECLARVRTHLELRRRTALLTQRTTELEQAQAHLRAEIAEHKQAVAELHASEERYRTTLMSVGDGVIVTDTTNRVTLLNPVAEALTGWSQQHAYSRPLEDVFQIVSEETRQPAENPAHRVMREGIVVGLANHTVLIAREGTERPIADCGAPIRNTNGDITGVVLIFRDQTAERATQLALEHSQQLLQSIIDHTPSLVYIFDVAGKCVLANRNLASLFGTTVESMRGQTRETWMPLDIATSHHQNDLHIIATRASAVREEVNEAADGKHIYLTAKFPLLDSTGTVYAVGGISTDITELKRAERERALLADTVTASLNEVYLFDADTLQFKFINAGALKNLQYTLAQAQQLTPLDLKPEFTRETFEQMLAPLRQREKPMQIFETVHRRADSTLYPVEVHLQLFEYDAERVFLAIIQDITERKQAQAHIQDLAKFPSENPNPVLRLRSDGTILYANAASQMLLREWACQVGDQAPKFWQDVVTQVLASQTHQRFDLVCGSVTYSMFVTHVPSADYVNLYGRDITERKRAEEALQATEERFRTIFENANDAIHISNAGNEILQVNPRMCKLMGYRREELLTMHIADLQAPEIRQPSQVTQNELARYGNATFEGLNLHRDGHGIPIEISVARIAGPQGDLYVSILRDITERKQAEARIQRQLEQLRALREIDVTISNSFDLRFTFEVLLSKVVSELRVDAAAVLLLSPHSHMLEFAAGRGFRSNVIEHAQMRLGEGYAGRAALEHRIIELPSLRDEPDSFARSVAITGEEFTTYYGVPLIVKGEVKGVLEIFHRTPHSADREWHDFMQMLAHQAAIAIDNAQLFDELEHRNFDLSVAYDATLEGWARALELRDPETLGHTQRVTEFAIRLARAMGLSDTDLVHFRRGALLHDIGKMAIPDTVLNKPGKLDSAEWALMRQHPQYAFELIHPIAYLRPALDIPYCHHEKWDGTGYPRGLKGDTIPLAARIFAVVDVWDALTSNRPYRAAWSREQALAEIQAQAGKHFDPEIVAVFLQSIKKF